MFSKPHIDREIKAVGELMKEGSFSKFIGAKHENVKDMLREPSVMLQFEIPEKSFLGGKTVRKFEALWSIKVKSEYSISVNSATSGLITALASLPKDNRNEVITTPFSFTASAAAISLSNYTPVFADIDIETFCLSPEDVKKKITKNTKAVLYVEWCGNAGHLKEIKRLCQEYNLYLIEDSSQAPLSKYEDKSIGTFGDLGVFSFNEPKNLMTGEGGMVVTDNPILAERCRLIRNHGEAIPDLEDEYLHDIIGYNFRLTEIQAAIGIGQLEKAELLGNIRLENYNYLKEKTEGKLIPQKITNSEYYPYTASFFVTVWTETFDIVKRLTKNNIPVSTGIPRLLNRHPYYKNLPNVYLSNAEKLNNQYLGFFQIGWPNTKKEMQKIVEVI